MSFFNFLVGFGVGLGENLFVLFGPFQVILPCSPQSSHCLATSSAIHTRFPLQWSMHQSWRSWIRCLWWLSCLVVQGCILWIIVGSSQLCLLQLPLIVVASLFRSLLKEWVLYVRLFLNFFLGVGKFPRLLNSKLCLLFTSLVCLPFLFNICRA